MKFFLPADAIILGGDFNCYEHKFDKFGGNVSIANYLTDFSSTFSFTNIWHNMHPHSRDVSCFNSNFTIGYRLDKFLVSWHIVSLVPFCGFSL